MDATNSSNLTGVSLKDLIGVKITVCTFYSIVFACSVFGNSLVIFVVATNRTMQNVTNLFIMNLAISDFAQTMTSLWMTPAYIYQGVWIYGKFLCYLFGLIQGGSIFISTFTLTAIAVDRYIVIIYPFRRRMAVKTCFVCILLVWTLAVVMIMPLMFKLNYGSTGIPPKYFCQEDWGDHMHLRPLYGVVILIVQYGIPFTINAFCYARIVAHLRRGMRSMQHARSAARHEQDVKRKQRLNQMLILMVVIFGACWLPMNVFNILRDATNGLLDLQSWFELAFLLAHLLAISSTMWNPILYAWKNENFKREFMAVLPCFPGVKRVRDLNARSYPTPTVQDGSTLLANTTNADEMSLIERNGSIVSCDTGRKCHTGRRRKDERGDNESILS